MFRRPVSNKQKDYHKDFITEDRINQSIRYFKIPAVKEKLDVLNFLLTEINEFKIIRPKNIRAKGLYVAIGSLTAAACLLLFLLYFAFSFETYKGIQGENNIHYLPDQSKVILNTNSTVRFSKLFFDRNVSLTGEVYLEVQKGSRFSVKSPNGEVEVLGTRFSVTDSDKGYMVYCFEGKVEVKYGKEKQQLFEGNKSIVENESLKLQSFNNLKYPEFIFFHHSFLNININDIWPIIEKHFDVKIYINNPIEKKFTGSFHTTDLEEVIEIICTSLNLEFEKGSNNEIFVETPL